MQTTAMRTVANSLPENDVILLTLLISKRYITYIDLRKKADSIPISRVKSHKKARDVPCGASLAGALLRQLVWRAIAFLRTFVQGESRSQVYLDYAEPPPKVHLYERLCKTPSKWLGRAVSPNVAHSPGQRPGET